MEPVHDLVNIKRLTLMGLAKKRRQFRYKVKKGLNLKDTDTVESVVSRAETTPIFDVEDFKMQVDRWLSSTDKIFLLIHLFILLKKSPY